MINIQSYMYTRDWESKFRLNLTQRVTGSLLQDKTLLRSSQFLIWKLENNINIISLIKLLLCSFKENLLD